MKPFWVRLSATHEVLYPDVIRIGKAQQTLGDVVKGGWYGKSDGWDAIIDEKAVASALPSRSAAKLAVRRAITEARKK